MFVTTSLQRRFNRCLALVEEAKTADASSGMVDVLANSSNPKHRQSQFLGFLR